MKKGIIMNETVCNNNGWAENGTKKFYRVSRWITIKHNYNPRPNNYLWDYVMDENGYKPYQDNFTPENGLYLDYFKWNGRNYAIEQFLCLGNPFYMPFTLSYENGDGKKCYLSGMDSENIYNPIFVEFDEYCERVRVYIEQ